MGWSGVHLESEKKHEMFSILYMLAMLSITVNEGRVYTWTETFIVDMKLNSTIHSVYSHFFVFIILFPMLSVFIVIQGNPRF